MATVSRRYGIRAHPFPFLYHRLRPSLFFLKTNDMQNDIQYHTTEQESKLAEDCEQNFRGTVYISLRRLKFETEYSRDIDKKNIERLKRIFSRQGCLRLSPSNHVPVIINEHDLKAGCTAVCREDT
jgi:hypothetical protein